MAYSIQSAFDRFYEAINLGGDHREIANARKNRIVSLLGNHFEILEAFATGSIPRYTALTGKADLDVIVALHYGKHIKDKTPADVLQSVRDALGEYRNQVRKNGQAVTLYYNTWPSVDIVPVSQSVDGNGNVTHYNVPNINTGDWIESTPKTHASDIDNRAGICGPNFRKVIKMMNSWNGNHSGYLQSYHIEVMALRAFNATMNDLPWDMFQFFQKCHELIGSSLWHGRGFADTYISYTDREEAKKRLAWAESKARDGWYQGTQNNPKNAIIYWKQIFGNSFPDYG
jgi:Second Messenger Oligonucleotide or Dinucleotide Synthetase domain